MEHVSSRKAGDLTSQSSPKKQQGPVFYHPLESLHS